MARQMFVMGALLVAFCMVVAASAAGKLGIQFYSKKIYICCVQCTTKRFGRGNLPCTACLLLLSCK